MTKLTKKQIAEIARLEKITRDNKTERLFSSVQTRYPHVQSVAAVGDSGKPTRVIIGCTADSCDATREIATQDAFQVCRCTACQRAFAKARRRKTPVATPKPKTRKRTSTKGKGRKRAAARA